MRLVAPPKIDPRPIDAFAASMRAWFVYALAWFAETLAQLPPPMRRHPAIRAAYAHVRTRLAANLRFAAHALRLLLFLRASERFVPPTARRPRLNHRAASSGFRYARKRSDLMRRFTACALRDLHRGDWRARIERLKRYYDEPAALIAHVLKRLRVMWLHEIGAALVLVSAQDACVSAHAPSAPAFVDSS